MQIFFLLLLKLIPLYILLFIGLIGSKRLHIKKESISSLLIYIIAPAVIFQNAASQDLRPALMLLPFLFFAMNAVVALFTLSINSSARKGDGRAHLAAFASAAGNTGYLGLPLILTFFGESMVVIAVMAILGTVLFECSIGFYMLSRGCYTPKQGLMKVIKLPTIYAFLLGWTVNYLGYKLHPNDTIYTFLTHFRGAYSILGMMVIGMALSDFKRSHLDMSLTIYSLLGKYLLLPLIIWVFILIDSGHYHILSAAEHKTLLIIGLCPTAANTVVFATQLKNHPGLAATTVLISTILSIVIIPLALQLIVI